MDISIKRPPYDACRLKHLSYGKLFTFEVNGDVYRRVDLKKASDRFYSYEQEEMHNDFALCLKEKSGYVYGMHKDNKVYPLEQIDKARFKYQIQQ